MWTCCLVAQSCPPFATQWTVAHQAPLSMGFSRQEYWSGLPCLSPGYLPDPGIKPAFLLSPALAGRFFTTSATWEAPSNWAALPESISIFSRFCAWILQNSDTVEACVATCVQLLGRGGQPRIREFWGGSLGPAWLQQLIRLLGENRVNTLQKL